MFHQWILPNIRKKWYQFSNLYQKTEAKGILPNSFCEANGNLIPKPDRHYNKEKLYINISHNMGPNLHSTTRKSNPTKHIENNISRTSGIYSRYAILVWHLKINVVHHIKRLKKKNHMIISVDTKRAFDKI